MKLQCECTLGKTGSSCEFDLCPNTLAGLGFSLGQLFFAGDKRLQDDSSLFAAMTQAEIGTADKYLHDLLFLVVDRDFDGVITKEEMVDKQPVPLFLPSNLSPNIFFQFNLFYIAYFLVREKHRRTWL